MDDFRPMATHVVREHQRRSAQIWWIIAAVALALVAGSTVSARLHHDPRAIVLVQATSYPTRTAPTSFKLIRHSRPTRLAIRSIDVATTVGVVGLQANRQVQVPNTIHTVSWYRYGPTPGEIGSAVILGHVDSHTGPGVFFALKTLKAKALIIVTLADGVVARFAVVKEVQYSKSNFPDRLVYGSHGQRLLNLVTCGGAFDHQTGHYESNVVVFSTLSSVSVPSKHAI